MQLLIISIINISITFDIFSLFVHISIINCNTFYMLPLNNNLFNITISQIIYLKLILILYTIFDYY